RSDQARFFVINMHDGSVKKYHTTHGSGSDPGNTGYAKLFGNEIGSNMSSLGIIRTAEVYEGAFGRSLRLDRLSLTNSNLRNRDIVIHYGKEIHEANVIQGLGGGCIMLDRSVRDHVIDEIR